MSAPRGRLRGGNRGGLRPRGNFAGINMKSTPSAPATTSAPQFGKVSSARSQTNSGAPGTSKMPLGTLPTWRDPLKTALPEYNKRMGDLFQKAKTNREQERKDAIRNGTLADPDKPTSLAEAITPVGTCRDMCPEFERVERIVQNMVEGCEKVELPNSENKVPCEAMMIKRFKRSAAGTDDQIPSDIRPPPVLKKTLDYILDELVGGPKPLASIHKYIWDRTRAIRNDFSIQQVTKVEDLKVAIECFETIARFHIVCLHQLSHPHRDNGGFDAHQEREQLNNTLLSLMYYYDDSRGRYQSPHEAEFRAYCVIFEIQEQRPDLEDRAQNWPKNILQHPRVQTALKLYAAAGNSTNAQGPLRPWSSFPIAQNFYTTFFTLIKTPQVSYLMACVAEVYFDHVRKHALDTIWRVFKGARTTKIEDMVLEEITLTLGFDSNDQTQKFCEEHGFKFGKRDDGKTYIDLNSASRIQDSNVQRRQPFSKVCVEAKRFGRTLPAVIRGMTMPQCRAAGLIEDTAPEEEYEEESLWVSDDEDAKQTTALSNPLPFSISPAPGANPFASPSLPASNPFGVPQTSAANPFASIPTPAAESSVPPAASKENPFAPPSESKLGSLGAPLAPNATLFGISAAPSSTSFGFPAASNSNPFGAPAATSASPFGMPSAASPSPFAVPPLSTSSSFVPEQKPTMSSAESAVTTAASTAFAPLPGQTDEKPAQSAFGPFTSTTNPFLSKSEITNSTSDTPIQAQATTSTAPHSLPGPTNPFSAFTPSTASPFTTPNTAPTQSSESMEPSIFPKPIQEVQTSTQPATSQEQTSTAPQPITFGPTQPSLLTIGTEQPTAAQKSAFGFWQPQAGIPVAKLSEQNNVPSSSTTASTTSQPSSFLLKPTPTSSAAQSAPSIFTPLPSSTPQSSLLPSDSRGPSGIPSPTVQEVPDKSTLQTSSHPQTIGKTVSFAEAAETSSRQNSVPTATTPPTKQPKSVLRKARPSPEAINRLAEDVTLGERGILEQYIENILDVIVVKSMNRVEREKERQLAVDARAYLLARKFGRRWRATSWNKKLARTGRERRQNFAQSMRSMAQSVSSASSPEVDPLASLLGVRPNHLLNSGDRSPNSTETRKRSFASTDARVDKESTSSRKGMPPPPATNGINTKRPKRSHHQRSQSVVSTESGLAAKIEKRELGLSASRARSLTSQLTIDEALVKKARRLASGRMDTTKTDYFRLKAMGINPDTPAIPKTLKRSRRLDEEEDGMNRKLSRSTPPDPLDSQMSTLPTPDASIASTDQAKESTSTYDPDEELFARARKAREEMARDMALMRRERELYSRSRSPSREPNGRVEVGTPSRTTLRLQKTGGHGLYNRVPREKKKEQEQEQKDEKENKEFELEIIEAPTTGAEVEANHKGKVIRRQPMFASVNSFQALGPGRGPQSDNLKVKGASAEDAIEL